MVDVEQDASCYNFRAAAKCTVREHGANGPTNRGTDRNLMIGARISSTRISLLIFIFDTTTSLAIYLAKSGRRARLSFYPSSYSRPRSRQRSHYRELIIMSSTETADNGKSSRPCFATSTLTLKHHRKYSSELSEAVGCIIWTT